MAKLPHITITLGPDGVALHVHDLTDTEATGLLLGAVSALNPGWGDAADAVFADGALADQLLAHLDANGETDD